MNENINDTAFERADQLIKYLNGELEEAEKTKVELWLAKDKANIQLLETIQDKIKLQNEMEFFSNLDQQKAWKKIASRSSAPRNAAFGASLLKYAAVSIFFIFSGIMLFFLSNKKEQVVKSLPEVKAYENDIEAGKDKARLTLADGSVISLEDLKEGAYMKDGNAIITKSGGKVIYKILDKGVGNDQSFNTISTPRGGQFQIILPDGSHVWLNAASSLRYPTSFNGNVRKVELIGEAYFEVSKNRNKPFHVLTDKNNIEVLGTHFNVMAYTDEALITTTLVEGSVKVTGGNNHKVLYPGQQAVYQKLSHQLKVQIADIDQVTAWKNGLFLFNNTDLPDIMRQLSRWYDVKMDYRTLPPVDGYTGILERSSRLSSVLKMLEIAGDVQFDIEGRRIIVKGEKNK